MLVVSVKVPPQTSPYYSKERTLFVDLLSYLMLEKYTIFYCKRCLRISDWLMLFAKKKNVLLLFTITTADLLFYKNNWRYLNHTPYQEKIKHHHYTETQPTTSTNSLLTSIIVKVYDFTNNGRISLFLGLFSVFFFSVSMPIDWPKISFSFFSFPPFPSRSSSQRWCYTLYFFSGSDWFIFLSSLSSRMKWINIVNACWDSKSICL